MKLDLDLLKAIVLALEDDPNRFDSRRPVDGYTWEQTDAHLCALIDLGYVDGSVVRTTAGPDGPCPPTACVNWGLTTPGQLFALQLRDDSFWKRAKEWVKKNAPSATGPTIEALISLCARAVG